MIEDVVQRKISVRECVGWLCHELASERTNSGQLSVLRKQSVDTPAPTSWWLLAKMERGKLQRNISENSERSWHLLVKTLAMLTQSGTPVRAKTKPAESDSKELDEQTGSSKKPPDVPLRSSLHQPDRPFGTALLSAGYSELRLAALLNSRDDRLEDQLLRACRFVLAKKEPFDCRELADLIFRKDPENIRYDQVRQRIARAYFRKAIKNETESKEST